MRRSAEPAGHVPTFGVVRRHDQAVPPLEARITEVTLGARITDMLTLEGIWWWGTLREGPGTPPP